MNVSRIPSQAIKLAETSPSQNSKISFQDVIQDQLERLNDTQIQSNQMTEAFVRGEVDDLHAVMIATEEARISLDLALQIRNKVVEAYKEINNMQL